jgi:hypothetical protein
VNGWDVLILLAVGLMVFFAVRAIRGGKSGSCHSAGCGHDCDCCEKSCKSGCLKTQNHTKS